MRRRKDCRDSERKRGPDVSFIPSTLTCHTYIFTQPLWGQTPPLKPGWWPQPQLKRRPQSQAPPKALHQQQTVRRRPLGLLQDPIHIPSGDERNTGNASARQPWGPCSCRLQLDTANGGPILSCHVPSWPLGGVVGGELRSVLLLHLIRLFYVSCQAQH